MNTTDQETSTAAFGREALRPEDEAARREGMASARAGTAERPRATLEGYPKKSVGLAGFLSAVFPGVGQVYIGYYQRGVVLALLFVTVIAILSSGEFPAPFFGPLLAFIWMYTVIDAVRRAQLFNLAVEGVRPMELPDDQVVRRGRGGSVVVGLLIAAAGFLIFLNRRFDVSLEWLSEWWPLGLVGFGLYLFVQGLRRRS